MLVLQSLTFLLFHLSCCIDTFIFLGLDFLMISLLIAVVILEIFGTTSVADIGDVHIVAM